METKTVAKVFNSKKLRKSFSKAMDTSIKKYISNVYKVYEIDKEDVDYSIRKFANSVFAGLSRVMELIDTSMEEFIGRSMNIFKTIPDRAINKKYEDELIDKFTEIFLIIRTIDGLRNKLNSVENKKEMNIIFLMLQSNIEMFESAVYDFTYNRLMDNFNKEERDPAKDIRIDMRLLRMAVNEYYIDFINDHLRIKKKKSIA